VFFDLDFFGEWATFIGMRHFTQQELINALLALAAKKGTAHISKADADTDPDTPASATFKRYFGSWTAALDAAGLESGIITGRPQNLPVDVSKEAIEIIEGELLGDGSMEQHSNACFSHSTANFNYAKLLHGKLETTGLPLRPLEPVPARNGGKPQLRTRTSCNISFTTLRQRWYPYGKKIVPSDLHLTKTMCLHWYLGDGYVEQHTVKFSTCGFTETEVVRLAALLTTLGFKASKNRRSGGHFVVRMSKEAAPRFLQWIGPCPAHGYEHKWNLA
jgi:LAGLIDADG DNA endonuclease family/Homing endonuclease associated repeat